MTVLKWLNENAGALQSIAAVVSATLALATIVVLYVTWTAIKDQAQAARELTNVAREQTKAAVDAAQAAQLQGSILSAQMEQATAPLLVCEPDDREKGFSNIKLVNRGQGVAFKAYYWRGGVEVRQSGRGIPMTPITPSTLGPGNSTYLAVPPVWDTITVCYRGTDRQDRWTVYYRDNIRPQEHIVQKGLQQVYLT